MTAAPKISVIIPVYNTEKYLKQCLDSIVGQSFKEIEIICVNDGSTDKSLSILEEYVKKDKRIIIINQKNLGSSAARNAGMKEAKGEYLHFCDSDDFCDLNMYETLYECAQKDEPDVIVFTFKRYDDLSNGIVSVYGNKMNLPAEKKFSYQNFPGNIFLSTTPSIWTKLFKSSFLKQRKFSFKDNISAAEDIAFTYPVLLAAGSIVYFDIPFYSYRINRPLSKILTHPHRPSSFLNSWQTVIDFVKEHNLYKKTPDNLYSTIVSSFSFEYNISKKKNRGADFILQCRKFLPAKYWKLFLKREKIRSLGNFAAVFNDNSFKHILIFNLHFKIKLKNRGRKSFKTAVTFVKAYLFFPWYLYKTYSILKKNPHLRGNKK